MGLGILIYKTLNVNRIVQKKSPLSRGFFLTLLNHLQEYILFLNLDNRLGILIIGVLPAEIANICVRHILVCGVLAIPASGVAHHPILRSNDDLGRTAMAVFASDCVCKRLNAIHLDISASVVSTHGGQYPCVTLSCLFVASMTVVGLVCHTPSSWTRLQTQQILINVIRRIRRTHRSKGLVNVFVQPALERVEADCLAAFDLVNDFVHSRPLLLCRHILAFLLGFCYQRDDSNIRFSKRQHIPTAYCFLAANHKALRWWSKRDHHP